MRTTTALALVFVSGCGAHAPPAAPPPPAAPGPVATASAEPEKPPEPLPTRELALKIDGGFVSYGLGTLSLKLWTDEELRQRLPAAARRELDTLARADERARNARRAASRAVSKLYECDGCAQERRLMRERDATRKASAKASMERSKVFQKTVSALQRQLDAPKAAPEVGIALARLQAGRAGSSAGRRSVRYGEHGERGPGTGALERAVALSEASTEVGQRARRELLHSLWAAEDEGMARRLVEELLRVAPADWKAELYYRSALFDAADGGHAIAAQGFELALANHVPGASVSRKTLAMAILVARYHAQDFPLALNAALQVFEESARPEPRPPAPAPAATSKAASKPAPAKSAKGTDPHVARSAALRDAAEYGMLGLLASTPWALDDAGVLRLAADSVERLSRDPLQLTGPAAARAGVLSVLATRALYRNDPERARKLAEAARALGSLRETRGALDVLRALALADGDLGAADALAKERRALPYGYGGSYARGDSEPDERELLQGLQRAARKDGARESEEDDEREPPVAQNVRSALRACIEPVRAALPPASGTGKTKSIATLTLRARVFPGGRVELDAESDRAEGSLPAVVACLEEHGQKYFAHAPASVRAVVTLDRGVRDAGSSPFGRAFGDLEIGRSFGGLTGSSIGDAFGAGGLGLRGAGVGGGGTGEGIGLGSVGTRGSGGGSGAGFGTGTGRLGRGKQPGKPPAPPASKK